MKPFTKLLFSILIFMTAGAGFAQQPPDSTLNQVKTTAQVASHLKKSKALRDNFNVSDLELRLAVNFDLNSDVLRPDAKAQLDTLAKVLKDPEFNGVAVELAGHTCDLGAADFNMELSKRRVKNAANYLVQHHQIPAAQISTRAYGKEMPLIPGATTEEERRVNRRVVVYLQENRAALEKMLREMPILKGFRWAVFKYSDDGKADLVSYDGSSILNSNDEYRIFVRPSRAKYVYLFQQDSKGNGQWVFPRNDIPYANPIPPGEYFFPSKEKVFVLDNTIGTELIYLVVADEPAADLEKLLQNNSSNLFADAMTQTIKVRGLKEVRVGQGPPADNPNIKQQTIHISSPNKQGEVLSNDRGLIVRTLDNDVVNVMAQHREFFMVLQFEHK